MSDVERLDANLGRQLTEVDQTGRRLLKNVTGICYFQADVVMLTSLPVVRRLAVVRADEHLRREQAIGSVLRQFESASDGTAEAFNWLQAANNGEGPTNAELMSWVEMVVELAIYRLLQSLNGVSRHHTIGFEHLIHAILRRLLKRTMDDPKVSYPSIFMHFYLIGAPEIEFTSHRQFAIIENGAPEDVITIAGRPHVLTGVSVCTDTHAFGLLRCVEAEASRLSRFYKLDHSTNHELLSSSAASCLAKLQDVSSTWLLYMPLSETLPTWTMGFTANVVKLCIHVHLACPLEYCTLTFGERGEITHALTPGSTNNVWAQSGWMCNVGADVDFRIGATNASVHISASGEVTIVPHAER